MKKSSENTFVAVYTVFTKLRPRKDVHTIPQFALSFHRIEDALEWQQFCEYCRGDESWIVTRENRQP